MEKEIGKKQIVLVLTEPTEGNEDEFNRYYEDVHLDEVIETTGWTFAQRFKLVDEAGSACMSVVTFEAWTDKYSASILTSRGQPAAPDQDMAAPGLPMIRSPG
ncbi:MAG: hypothetical protein ABGY96_27755 [bacterium]|nr:hypothetical protein [Gammaproteobacteria bacterium]